MNRLGMLKNDMCQHNNQLGHNCLSKLKKNKSKTTTRGIKVYIINVYTCIISTLLITICWLCRDAENIFWIQHKVSHFGKKWKMINSYHGTINPKTCDWNDSKSSRLNIASPGDSTTTRKADVHEVYSNYNEKDSVLERTRAVYFAAIVNSPPIDV